ncbi:MAG: hypothetical protein EPO63_00555 [Candidatus Nitrosotenuis sp.]|nr:MAG: hypothetical protein EPO63_00555 [Candidatus Nitrosotenuis sp.]
MIEKEDAVKVLQTIAENLLGVAGNPSNFQRLPDDYWGYYAKGHDKKGKFGVIVTYSEQGADVEDLLIMYRDWADKNKKDSS